jgi:hypothetical protein
MVFYNQEKKMRNILILLLFLLPLGHLNAEKVVRLPEVLKPHTMAVDENQLYICEFTSISIYSLDDFSLVKRFGRKGEGPMEFKGSTSVNCQTDRLIISSTGKISIFNKDGEFIEEMKNNNLFIRGFKPIQDKYVAEKNNFREKRKIVLCDSKLAIIKDLFEEKTAERPGVIFGCTLDVHTYKNKIYISGGKNFTLDVFDIDGKRLFSVNRDYKLIKFTDDHKHKFLESYRKNPVTKQFYTHFKKKAIFSDYFPAIRKFIVADGKIYVHTYKVKNNKTEFFIFEENGKFLKAVYLPVFDKEFMSPAIYRIKNGKLFQLVEGEDKEEWEIHITEIE